MTGKPEDHDVRAFMKNTQECLRELRSDQRKIMTWLSGEPNRPEDGLVWQLKMHVTKVDALEEEFRAIRETICGGKHCPLAQERDDQSQSSKIAGATPIAAASAVVISIVSLFAAMRDWLITLMPDK